MRIPWAQNLVYLYFFIYLCCLIIDRTPINSYHIQVLNLKNINLKTPKDKIHTNNLDI